MSATNSQHDDQNERIAGLKIEQLFWLVLAATAPVFGTFLLSQAPSTNTAAIMIAFAQVLGGTAFGLYRFSRVTRLAELVAAIRHYPTHWLCGVLTMCAALMFTLSVPGLLQHGLAILAI